MEKVLAVSYLCFCLIHFALASDFINVTASLLEKQHDDIIAAFGDMNGDKLTDVFVINGEGKQIDVLLDSLNHRFARKSLVFNESDSEDNVIVGLIVSDFDADVQLDLLAIKRKATASHKDNIQLSIYWGNINSISIEQHQHFTEEFQDDPVLFDYNQDMIPDLFLVKSNGDQVVWLGQHDRNFTQVALNKLVTLAVPHSSAFIDLSNDFSADLFLTATDGYNVFLDNYKTQLNSYPLPDDCKYVGQSGFIDFNQDTTIDHIVPACSDADCKHSYIFAYRHSQWHKLIDGFLHNGVVWSFVPEGTGIAKNIPQLCTPVTLHFGDYNMDGFPDAIAVLSTSAGSSVQQRAFLLKNVPCSTGICADIGRGLEVQWDMDFTVDGVLFAAFLDFYADGKNDLVISSLSTSADSGASHLTLTFYENTIKEDTCFLKVTVLSGTCNYNCQNARQPYSVDTPGPVVCYKTTNPTGDKQKSCAGQLAQSAHFALQPPYILFGLGQTPNFIENIDVGVTKVKNDSDNVKEYTQIVPNSQLFVIPYPTNKPLKWDIKLFVTPGPNVYYTGLALLCTCVVGAVIVGILQWKEMREDAQEKKQESQKFHFDAM